MAPGHPAVPMEARVGKPKKIYGIRTLADIRDRCCVVDGHWMWKGAFSKGQGGQTRIWAPDYTRGGVMYSQPGPRAVWHAKTGSAIPEGNRIFRTCCEVRCVNPDHVACQHVAERGKQIADSGKWKGVPARIVANRTTTQKRSTVTGEALELILKSDLVAREITALTGVGRTTISRLRRGDSPIATGIFAGLMS
jgi:hypothetical protein